MQTQAKDREVSSLYVLKALCAMGVVALHAPSGWATNAVQLIASVSVPIFYMITGYFLYNADVDKLSERLVGSIKKITLVILITHAVYTLAYWQSIPPLSQYMLWFKWIVLGQHFAGGHLWYLTALLEALILFWLLVRTGYAKYIPYFVACLALKFVFEDYRELLFGSQPSMMAANALFYAIPFVALGFVFRQYKSYLTSLSCATWAMFAAIALAYINRFLLEGLVVQILLTPVARVAMVSTMFVVALQQAQWGKGSYLELVGKDLSGNIYYWHDFMIRLAMLLLGQSLFQNYGALVATVLSIVLAYGVVRLQKLISVRWLP